MKDTELRYIDQVGSVLGMMGFPTWRQWHPFANVGEIKKMWVHSLCQEDPRKKHGNPLQYSENPHEQRSLQASSSWGLTELETTKAT